MAVNRAVPLMYPEIKAEFGNQVTYVQSPKSHVMVEFAFDVVQVAAGAYAPAAYHSYIGFKVAKPALERAFLETYGLEMTDIFGNEDLAIATYRHAVGTTIPEMTKVAWGKKRDEILKVTPGMKRKTFVFNLPRKQYDKEYGSDYAKPHGFARFLGLVYNLVPKIGPFRSLGFKVPTPEAERLFLESFTATRQHYPPVARRRARRPAAPAQHRFRHRPADGAWRIPARGRHLRQTARQARRPTISPACTAALSANLVAYYGAADRSRTSWPSGRRDRPESSPRSRCSK